nr:MAG TPA: hypothetical protein [Caudoviricetes sp.]
MTKEQEEAIEIIDKMIKSYIEADECGLSNNDFKHEIEAMQTVLNMLNEKEKKIEFQKDINKIEKDRHKKTEKSLKGQIIKNNKIIEKLEKEAQKYFEEIIKQARVIDLMAEKIFQEGIIWDDKEDVKQYFKSKTEKEYRCIKNGLKNMRK